MYNVICVPGNYANRPVLFCFVPAFLSETDKPVDIQGDYHIFDTGAEPYYPDSDRNCN